jgi:hypothetical protein
VEEEGGGILTTKGIGLGLSVCKQITEQLGGKLEITSEEGEGTLIMFSILIKCVDCENQSLGPLPLKHIFTFMPINFNPHALLSSNNTTKHQLSKYL